MKKYFVIVLFFILLESSGCTYWYQNGTTFDECDQDLQDCYCSLTRYSDMHEIGNYEVDFIKDCMECKGYTLTLEDDLPTFVKRRDPDMNTFWLLAGTSGTVD